MMFLAFHDFKVIVKFQMMFADEFLTGRIALKEPLTIYTIHPHILVLAKKGFLNILKTIILEGSS